MHKLFEYIGLLSLMCFSFIITEKTTKVAHNMDPIMIDIKNNKKKYELKSKDALIKENTIIPGVCGKKININKSYSEMKMIGMFDEKLLQYDYYLPTININNNSDKYILKGNSYKNYIYILIDLNESNKQMINLYNFNNYNFIVQYNFFKNNKKLINYLIKNNNSILIDNTNFKKLKDISKYYLDKTDYHIYCYNDTYDDYYLKMCSNNKNNTIGRKNIISYNYLYYLKHSLKRGMIYRFSLNNKLINEIYDIEKYIFQKGITLSNIDNSLKEC